MDKNAIIETLQKQAPLPEWAVDSAQRQGIALGVANTIGQALASWPGFDGIQVQEHLAQYVADRVGEFLKVFRGDEVVDPTDPLQWYVTQLGLMQPGQPQDVERYRKLLRFYGQYLVLLAEEFEE